MKERKEYSRFVQNVHAWKGFKKGSMIQLLHTCVEHDITSFDTADFHGKRHAGREFGTALSESGLSRDQIQLLGKVSDPNDPEELVRCVDKLLLDLRTDYLDLLLLGPLEEPAESLETLKRLYGQGKIREIGSTDLLRTPQRENQLPMLAQQIPSPLLNPEGLKALEEEKAGRAPLTSLMWWETQTHPHLEPSPALRDLARKHHKEPTQLLLIWLLGHPAHLHPVILAKQAEEIISLAAAKEVQLDAFDWQKIRLILS